MDTGNQNQQCQMRLWKCHTTACPAERGPELARPLESAYYEELIYLDQLFVVYC